MCVTLSPVCKVNSSSVSLFEQQLVGNTHGVYQEITGTAKSVDTDGKLIISIENVLRGLGEKARILNSF